MLYGTNEDNFKFAVNFTFKNDAFIQNLFFKAYELITKVLDDGNFYENDIQYTCKFKEEDIYDFYFYFFMENSKLFAKEMLKIRKIQPAIKKNYLEENNLGRIF